MRICTAVSLRPPTGSFGTFTTFLVEVQLLGLHSGSLNARMESPSRWSQMSPACSILRSSWLLYLFANLSAEIVRAARHVGESLWTQDSCSKRKKNQLKYFETGQCHTKIIGKPFDLHKKLITFNCTPNKKKIWRLKVTISKPALKIMSYLWSISDHY